MRLADSPFTRTRTARESPARGVVDESSRRASSGGVGAAAGRGVDRGSVQAVAAPRASTKSDMRISESSDDDGIARRRYERRHVGAVGGDGVEDRERQIA